MSRSLKISSLIAALVFIASACNKQVAVQPASPDASQGKPAQNDKSQVYENQYMKVVIPAGWTATQANQTIYSGNCVDKTNCTQTTKSEPNPAAVNIIKGNYILYINTQATQASGVTGGRFGEIAMGAPSADAVVVEQPSPPCGTSEKTAAFADYSREDLYVNNLSKENYCHVPSNGATVWYFSYLTDSRKGYFNYYNNDNIYALVVTMAYNSKNVNSLPVKGSTSLNTALNEMTNILKSLEIKKK